MTKRILILGLNLIVAWAFLACGALTPAETTTTSALTTSTTYYYVMNERVYYHFESIDFSTFSFVEARHYRDPDHPDQYTVLTVNGEGIKDSVNELFEKFDAKKLFPYKSNRFMKYRIYFASGNEEIIVTLHEYSTNRWISSFIHLENGVELYSQQYRDEAFPTEFDDLLSFLQGLGEL